ncbi:DnaD domain protein [Lentilactobacillus sp. IMAU92037]|uniref:replication initiation and membrane attachment family protein n=1 Tax=Lentilactobacillus TaxID=2767893 RepID=UPI001C25AFA9|nr:MULTISPECIES: DnaD domain protein [Lentilactobacillus]MBU9789197.1 DnaD domain protein [Lentilactobacillus dabitei]MBV0929810.1 DnaD domain protein [Lentilactobacillus dabitei]MDM7515608.1 DnaD domain protein [Lentilactobacillus sp. TOM.63]
MADAFNKLTPDSKFVVVNATVNGMLDHNVLNNLYLPIIGDGALQLYELLWNFSVSDHNQLVLHKHYELQSMLNIGTDKIVAQRKLLEAVNLLGTFTSRKSPDSLVYAMQVPLSAKEFLKTDILAVMLLGKVGDETYKQIVSRLIAPLPDLGDLKNISASLLDTFDVPTTLIKNIPGTVNETKQVLNDDHLGASNDQLRPQSDDFDFNLILEMLNNSYVDQPSVKKSHDLILSEHLLYGIDEVEMVKLIQKATNLSTNELDQRRLKMLISQQFEMRQPANKVKAEPGSQESEKSAQNFDAATEQLIKITQSNAPMTFLQQIKDQKHGIVTPGEERILRDLVNKRVFPNEVLNLLVYQILVVEKHSTLNQNLISTIADDWSQKHVSSAQDAINALRNRGKERAEKTTRRYSKKRINVKETLPDWAKQPQKSQPKQSKQGLSPEQKKQLEQQLNQLKKQK